MIFPALFATLLLVSACDTSTESRSSNGNVLAVLTTTALLTDLVRNLGGNLVEVTALVPPGAEVHSFQSTPADSVAVSRAGLLISNGGELDRSLDPVLLGSKGDEALHIVAAGPLLAAGESDPHFWQNPVFSVIYAEEIKNGLIASDPVNAGVYETNFESYKGELTQLDLDIANTLDTVDSARRHLITFHDAFHHFGRRYGWEVTAFVASDGSEISPNRVVKILEIVRDQGTPAVFAEPQFRAGVLLSAAKEAGIEVGVIYSDALDDDVPTYIDMMLFNAKSLARLLK